MSTMDDPTTPKKRRPRRRFSEEFKVEAVRLVLDEGQTIAAVAKDLDLVPSALNGWVAQARADRTHGRTGLTTAEREELARLGATRGGIARNRHMRKRTVGCARRCGRCSRRADDGTAARGFTGTCATRRSASAANASCG